MKDLHVPRFGNSGELDNFFCLLFGVFFVWERGLWLGHASTAWPHFGLLCAVTKLETFFSNCASVTYWNFIYMEHLQFHSAGLLSVVFFICRKSNVDW